MLSHGVSRSPGRSGSEAQGVLHGDPARVLLPETRDQTRCPIHDSVNALSDESPGFHRCRRARSGIAAYSAELLPLLDARGQRDRPLHRRQRPRLRLETCAAPRTTSSSISWGTPRATTTCGPTSSAIRGLVVLHDAQLHQARALALTKRWLPRRDDYLAEFARESSRRPASDRRGRRRRIRRSRSIRTGRTCDW